MPLSLEILLQAGQTLRITVQLPDPLDEFGGLTRPGLRAITSDRAVHTRVRALVQTVLGQAQPNDG